MILENSYATLPGSLYTLQSPKPVKNPELVLWNSELVHELNLPFHNLSKEELAAIFSGNQNLEGSIRLAQAYAGHQFGHFTMLGDGRALLLGEVIGLDRERYDIQLKGSGVTPYSRGGDGLATLSAMLREYLMSEALYYLGVPSSRSLAVVTTGEPVYRLNQEKGAILTRVMRAHLRIGTFQYASHFQSKEVLQELISYTIQRLYPEITDASNPALSLLAKVMERQIKLIVEWLRVGFIHGVMNTDNTSISGESFDYGPGAFMSYYRPSATFSSIDASKRYAFGNQGPILEWNLYRLAEALLPVIHEESAEAIQLAETTLKPFSAIFQSQYLQMMKNKLGIVGEDKSVTELMERLLRWMEGSQVDYTNTFLELLSPGITHSKDYQDPLLDHWKKDWLRRIQGENELPNESITLMKKNNPSIIPRPNQVEKALSLATERSDFSLFCHLLESIKNSEAGSQYSELMEPPTREYDQRYKTFCNT